MIRRALLALCFWHAVLGDVFESDDACHKSNASECSASWLQRRAHRVRDNPPADAHELAMGEEFSASHSSDSSSIRSMSTANSSAGFCDTHTGGTCKYFSCGSSRGQTQCVEGQCRCQPGHCSVGGRCVPNDPSHNFLQCPQRTGGTCSWFGYCWKYRGPTRCVQGECMCKPGFLEGTNRGNPILGTTIWVAIKGPFLSLKAWRHPG